MVQPLISNLPYHLQLVLAASAVLGLTINHSTFLCTQVNEPLMTSVAGNLKNVLMVRDIASRPAGVHHSTAYTKHYRRTLQSMHCAPCCIMHDTAAAVVALTPQHADEHAGRLLVLVALQTVVGAVAFPDFLYSTPNVLGLALSMIGAVWYAMQSAMRVGSCPSACLRTSSSTVNCIV